METRFLVDAAIQRASTLPGEFYRSGAVFDELRERVFARSWQWIGHERDVALPGHVRPFKLLRGSLNEPLVLSRDHDGVLRCLSNVCSHRGNLIVSSAGPCRKLRCRYHGRRFQLDGKMEFMPEFHDAESFPTSSDDLPRVPLGDLRGFLFASLDPLSSFGDLTGEMEARIGHLPLEVFRFDPARSREYLVHAHWALYVDNYLEGFHLPYIHPGLSASVDYEKYRTENHAWSSLQVAEAKGAEQAFEPIRGASNETKRVAAYYFWLFPNTMFNFYPWGLSVNIVQPLAIDRTKVSFSSYVWRPELIDQGAGAELDQVEREDEHVVEQVQKGIRSRLYKRGRFSPSRETAVHHFHRLLQTALA